MTKTDEASREQHQREANSRNKKSEGNRIKRTCQSVKCCQNLKDVKQYKERERERERESQGRQ